MYAYSRLPIRWDMKIQFYSHNWKALWNRYRYLEQTQVQPVKYFIYKTYALMLYFITKTSLFCHNLLCFITQNAISD